MTCGAFGDHRCSIFNRTRITLHECFDQHRRLTEILFWLAAAFMPTKLRNNELENCITFRHWYAHHDAAVRTKHGNFLRCCQEVSQVRQPLGMRIQFWNGHGRILVIRGGYKQVDPKIRAAAFFERRAALTAIERRYFEKLDAGCAQHVEKSRNSRDCQGLPTSDVHIFSGKWRGSYAECVQQRTIGMRTDQQRSGPKQTAVMQACQREIGFSINGGESSAGEQPHSRYRRVGGDNHFAQRTYPALDLGIVNLSEVYFLTSVQSIGIAMDPKVGAGFIGALRQSSGSSQ